MTGGHANCCSLLLNREKDYEAFSYGFSNRTWDTTLEILASHRMERIVDIRTLPGSRYAPQFNLEHLRSELPRAGVEYLHLKALGGLRKPDKGSFTNAGWRNESFRAYADYMQTPEFLSALDDLIRMIREKPTAFACTEAVFWKCHRHLVSDALLIRGIAVDHVFDAQKVEPHELTKFARVHGMRITYP